MPLYRLDFLDPDGAAQAPVRGMAGDFLARHMQTARSHGTAVAAATDSNVLVTRIDNAGNMKPSLIIRPDGTTAPPPQARHANPREVCRKSQGGSCFCTPCRAERAEGRS